MFSKGNDRPYPHYRGYTDGDLSMMQLPPGDTQKHLMMPSLANKRASVPNFSRVLQGRVHSAAGKQPRRTSSIKHYNPPSIRMTAETKRWDPHSQGPSAWDGLRHDPELWSQDGDCYIHLYGKGRSQRGPSFRISRTDIDAVRWNINEGAELFLAAPENAVKEDIFRWHLTTRNFIAWMIKKPLVGVTLGEALIDLLDRMRLFRPHADNTGDLVSYLNELGYKNFTHKPDHALALLHFAEHYRLKTLWTDAFSHCVGMNDQLCSSLEYTAISRVTKALISRSYLEMDLHLGRVSKALKTFLEDELSTTYFGLSDGAQAHLERFRSFLHSFYVNQFGYWPPEESYSFSKALLRSMYDEFHTLYMFLADRTSSDNMQGLSMPASGGICVLQNVGAFNQRHSYKPLPHPLPLIPECHGSTGKTQSQRGLRALRLGSKQPTKTKFEEGMSLRSALVMATNSAEPEVLDYPLIRDYVRFEQEWSVKPKEKVSVVDARKVRWIVVYTILQMLTSVVHAPKEVEHPELAPYHMCLLTTGTPPWGVETREVETYMPVGCPAAVELDAEANEISVIIRPDCEILDRLPRRSNSDAALRPAPLRLNSGRSLMRMSSLRSFSKQVHSRSASAPVSSSVFAPSISTASSQDRDVFTYNNGNGLSSTSMQRGERSPVIAEEFEEAAPQPSEWDEKLVLEARAPVLDLSMLNALAAEFDSSSSSSSSAHASSPVSTHSSAMSASEHSWQFDDADTFSWSSGDDRRNSRGVYSMEHESVCSSGSTRKLDRAPSTPGTPTPVSRNASGYFSMLTIADPEDKQVDADDHGYVDCLKHGEQQQYGEEEMPGLNAQFDMHQALELLPRYITAQAL